MKLIAACEQCERTIVFPGIRSSELYFCSHACRVKRLGVQKFCESCLKTSSTEEFKGSFWIQGFGTGVFGGDDECFRCHSKVMTKWFVCVFPIFPTSSYRMVQPINEKFVGRRVPIFWPQVVRMYLYDLMGVFLIFLFFYLSIVWR